MANDTTEANVLSRLMVRSAAPLIVLPGPASASASPPAGDDERLVFPAMPPREELLHAELLAASAASCSCHLKSAYWAVSGWRCLPLLLACGGDVSGVGIGEPGSKAGCFAPAK